jgi:predicted SAM-dependent methyltransferase
VTRVNVGCGQTPTEGWKNYDNSWSVRLAHRPLTAGLLGKIGLLNGQHREFVQVARSLDIRWADATRYVPEPDHSVDVLYSSHMIEHMDRDQVLHFLKEARRILKPGGVLRLAVPDLRYHVDNYLRDRDADRFVERTLLTRSRPRSFLEKLKYLLTGDRHHQWMYDGESLCKLLSALGFQNPQVMEAGTTIIPEPGLLNLREREPESVFVEAVN